MRIGGFNVDSTSYNGVEGDPETLGLGTGNYRILNSFTKNSRMVLKAARGKAGEVFPRSRGGLLSFGLRRIHIGFPQIKLCWSKGLSCAWCS